MQLTGSAGKRGLIPRIASPDRLIADVDAWIRAEYPDALRSARTTPGADGGVRLLVDLHPAARPVSITAREGGKVDVVADAPPAGPGYETFVRRLLDRLGSALAIEWGTPGDAMPLVYPDRRSVEADHLRWLRMRLVAARDARTEGGVHLDTPPGVRFTFDGAIATVLGPRNAAWLESALADPRIAVGVVPWWADATDERYLLNRALTLIWTEMRWRKPATDAEVAVHDEALSLLRRAFPLDPSLPYPWLEWAELLDQRGVDDAMARQVRSRVAAMGEERRPMGYRREAVTVIHEGWKLEIPGSFGETRTDEELWVGEGGRGITLAAVETGTATGPMPPETFLSQVAAHLGADAIAHRDGPLVGRARLTTDGSSGVEVGVLEAYSAVVGRGAAIRIVFDDPADWQWAFDTWRALAPA